MYIPSVAWSCLELAPNTPLYCVHPPSQSWYCIQTHSKLVCPRMCTACIKSRHSPVSLSTAVLQQQQTCSSIYSAMAWWFGACSTTQSTKLSLPKLLSKRAATHSCIPLGIWKQIGKSKWSDWEIQAISNHTNQQQKLIPMLQNLGVNSTCQHPRIKPQNHRSLCCLRTL